MQNKLHAANRQNSQLRASQHTLIRGAANLNLNPNVQLFQSTQESGQSRTQASALNYEIEKQKQHITELIKDMPKMRSEISKKVQENAQLKLANLQLRLQIEKLREQNNGLKSDTARVTEENMILSTENDHLQNIITFHLSQRNTDNQ